MSDDGQSYSAGWYPDPSPEGQGRLRYYDGQRWTDHLAPANPPGDSASAAPTDATPTTAANEPLRHDDGRPAVQPVPATGAPATKRRRVWPVFAGAGAVVVIGIGALFVWGIPAITGDADASSAYSDPDSRYDYRSPVTVPLDERDRELNFPASYDLNAESIARGGTKFDTGWAYHFFADSGLTQPLSTAVLQTNPGKPLRVYPQESNDSAIADLPDALQSGTVPLKSSQSNWGLRSDYFLVQYVDEAGSKLERPIVTKYTAESELPAPAVTVTTDPDDIGSVKISWTEVAKANGYMVMVSKTDDAGLVSRRVVGTTDGAAATSWSSKVRTTPTDYPWSVDQNDGMTMYQTSADDTVGTTGTPEDDGTNYEYGVVAVNTDKKLYAPYASVSAVQAVGTLPNIFASSTWRALNGGSAFDSVDKVPTDFPYVALDGTVRSTPGHMITDYTLKSDDGTWTVQLMGEGTRLRQPVSIGQSADVNAAIASYNSRAEQSAAKTGGIRSLDAAPVVDTRGVKTAPDTDLPLFGSNPYTQFLEKHLLAGTTVIDVSDWTGTPGSPDTSDALYEALDQNPYVSVESETVLGDKVFVTYQEAPAEMKAAQSALRTKVREIVGQVVTDGMDDAQKAKAINKWIIGNAEYDYPALNHLTASGDISGFEYAWSAAGILEDGKAVCMGYALAFNALAHEAGLDSEVITGTVEQAAVSHAWNKVKIAGSWKAVDTTWNDSPAPNQYLLIDDSQFTGPATRTQDLWWIVDTYAGNYATK